nr:hypothetical protein HmN_000955100 [Hymenolepis microstoma]
MSSVGTSSENEAAKSSSCPVPQNEKLFEGLKNIFDDIEPILIGYNICPFSCPTPSQSPPPSPRRGCGNDKPEVEAKTEGSGDASDKGKSNGV